MILGIQKTGWGEHLISELSGTFTTHRSWYVLVKQFLFSEDHSLGTTLQWCFSNNISDKQYSYQHSLYIREGRNHVISMLANTLRLLTHLKEYLHFFDFHFPFPQLFLPGALGVFVGVSGRSVLVPLSILTASSWKHKTGWHLTPQSKMQIYSNSSMLTFWCKGVTHLLWNGREKFV